MESRRSPRAGARSALGPRCSTRCLWWCWRRLRAADRLPALALIGYALGFLLMMTLGAKKLDRYVLPMFPALGVLAALGLAGACRSLQDRGFASSQPAAAICSSSTAVPVPKWMRGTPRPSSPSKMRRM